MESNEIIKVVEQLNEYLKIKSSFLTNSQITDCIVHMSSLFILSKHESDIATSYHQEVPPDIYLYNLKFRDVIIKYLDSLNQNFGDFEITQQQENLIIDILENISRKNYLFLIGELLKSEYEILCPSIRLNTRSLDINVFQEEINNCKIENKVDSSYFYGDRRKVSYTLNRFYDLNKIKDLKKYYTNCQHPYLNWTFQFVSRIYDDKIDYLERVFKKLSNMDFSTEQNDPYYIYGYAFSLLALIDLYDKSMHTSKFHWYKILKLGYLFLTQFILISNKKLNIMMSDSYSNRARLMHANEDDFNFIFFTAGAMTDVRFNYVTDKYLAYCVADGSPFREDFLKDAMMMYQNGSVKRVTGNCLSMDGTFEDVIRGGVMRSDQLYTSLFNSFTIGDLYLSEIEVVSIFKKIRDKWLTLKPIYPILLDKELGNVINKLYYDEICRDY